jgi:hypothetical protein
MSYERSLLNKEINSMPKKSGQATLYAQLFPDKENFMTEFFKKRNLLWQKFLQTKKPICKNNTRQQNSHGIYNLDEETYMPEFFQTNELISVLI